MYETIHEAKAEAEAEGDRSRGSVSVPVKGWGQWPADTRPEATAAEDQGGEPPNTCGWGSSGRPIRTRSYTVISTTDFTELQLGSAKEVILTAAFGTPVLADRDRSLECELIAQIQTPSGSSAPILVGVGLAALGAAVAVMYMTRRNEGVADPDMMTRIRRC